LVSRLSRERLETRELVLTDEYAQGYQAGHMANREFHHVLVASDMRTSLENQDYYM